MSRGGRPRPASAPPATAKQRFVRALLVIGIGAGGGFLVASLIGAFAILSASMRYGWRPWTGADAISAGAMGAVVGVPSGVVLFPVAYLVALRRRLEAKALAILAAGTFIGGITGAVVALPLGMFTAVFGFGITCAILAGTWDDEPSIPEKREAAEPRPINPETRKWIDAAITLVADHEAAVPCPACGHERLDVIEVDVPNAPGVQDVYIICASCGKRVVASGVRSPDNPAV